MSDETRINMSISAKERGVKPPEGVGTEAAKTSPKGGRFTTNSSAKGWTLLSPDGVRYRCTNLMHFIREHAADFGIAADDDAAVKRVHNGIRTVKQMMKRGNGCLIYGWSLVEWDDRKNCEKYPSK